ncbi:MAG TPA: homoserine dehydrogenase [Chloroflexia bacterium]|nr:homoserine dehydrogenase [Chloroflexia bacterium]
MAANTTPSPQNTLQIVQLGLGGVGQALVRHYIDLAGSYPWLRYAGIADRSGLLLLEGGWTLDDLQSVLSSKAGGSGLAQFAGSFGARANFTPASEESAMPPLDALFSSGERAAAGEFVVVDVTAERKAYDALVQARQHGAHLVLCNKWALAEDIERYDALVHGGSGRFLYETTVGAALPVINVLDSLLRTGDEVTAIDAAISGTLGYISTEIQTGVPFSAALAGAQSLGYTEPDPRDDLGGVDARRKALILARRLGMRLNMADIQVESLVPPGLDDISLTAFWQEIPLADMAYVNRVAEARARGNVLRYLARIDASGASVALREVPLDSLAGGLSGTESLFVFHTRRYGEQPLAVRGRGAGAEITASGVLGDILRLGGVL